MIPPKEQGLGHWGFNVELDSDFARRLREHKMDEWREERFRKEALEIIKRYKLNGLFDIPRPYKFMEGSWLLHFVIVPGNAYALGLGQMCQEDFFENGWKTAKDTGLYPNYVAYDPHNVDTMNQVVCLLSLWVHWANTANTLFSMEGWDGK